MAKKDTKPAARVDDSKNQAAADKVTTKMGGRVAKGNGPDPQTAGGDGLVRDGDRLVGQNRPGSDANRRMTTSPDASGEIGSADRINQAGLPVDRPADNPWAPKGYQYGDDPARDHRGEAPGVGTEAADDARAANADPVDALMEQRREEAEKLAEERPGIDRTNDKLIE